MTLPVPSHALTLWQPWASFIACGAKRIETRRWMLREPQRPETIAIHAAKRPVEWTPALQRIAVDTIAPAADVARTVEAARGCIVAVARLVAIHTTSEIRRRLQEAGGRRVLPVSCLRADEMVDWQVGQLERHLGDFSDGRFGWWLADIVALRQPIACPGAQGLWAIPLDVHARVAAQVAPLYAPLEELVAP